MVQNSLIVDNFSRLVSFGFLFSFYSCRHDPVLRPGGPWAAPGGALLMSK